MEKKVVYIRNKKSINESMLLTEVYRVYALNNNLPVYNKKLKTDGDYFNYLGSNGIEETREASATYDEMIAKIIATVFDEKYIYVNSKIVDKYVKQKNTQELSKYFISELENDLHIEAGQIQTNGVETVVLRFGKHNVLDMGTGTVTFDENNELHVAFGKVRRALYDVAEGLCQ